MENLKRLFWVKIEDSNKVSPLFLCEVSFRFFSILYVFFISFFLRITFALFLNIIFQVYLCMCCIYLLFLFSFFVIICYRICCVMYM